MTKIRVPLVLLALAGLSFAQDARESVGIDFRAADSISVRDRNARIIIDRLGVEIEGKGQHDLTYENASESPRTITIHASEPLPDGFFLIAAASSVVAGESNGSVQVRFGSSSDLIIDIGPRASGGADVRFTGTATKPMSGSSRISVTYTIVGQ